MIRVDLLCAYYVPRIGLCGVYSLCYSCFQEKKKKSACEVKQLSNT